MHTTVLVTPMRWRLPCTDRRRSLLSSLAKMQPVLRISAARYVVFPPGAAAISTTDSFSCGASAMHGKNEDAPCKPHPCRAKQLKLLPQEAPGYHTLVSHWSLLHIALRPMIAHTHK